MVKITERGIEIFGESENCEILRKFVGLRFGPGILNLMLNKDLPYLCKLLQGNPRWLEKYPSLSTSEKRQELDALCKMIPNRPGQWTES